MRSNLGCRSRPRTESTTLRQVTRLDAKAPPAEMLRDGECSYELRDFVSVI